MTFSRTRRDRAVDLAVIGVDQGAPIMINPMSGPPVAEAGRGVLRKQTVANPALGEQAEVLKRGFPPIHFAEGIGAEQAAAEREAPAGLETEIVALVELQTIDHEVQVGLVHVREVRVEPMEGHEVQAGRVVTWVQRSQHLGNVPRRRRAD